MEISHEFEIQAPSEIVWEYLVDVERLIPCMPGAELTQVVDERTFRGRVNVTVGPIRLSFAGVAIIQERDDIERRIVVKADGQEQRGKGAASASVVSSLEDIEGATKVTVVADLRVTGAVAQYGQGVIQDITARLTSAFAVCLEATISKATRDRAGAAAGDRPPAGANTDDATRRAEPVKGLRLALWAVWRAFVRALRRLFRPSRP